MIDDMKFRPAWRAEPQKRTPNVTRNYDGFHVTKWMYTTEDLYRVRCNELLIADRPARAYHLGQS